MNTIAASKFGSGTRTSPEPCRCESPMAAAASITRSEEVFFYVCSMTVLHMVHEKHFTYMRYDVGPTNTEVTLDLQKPITVAFVPLLIFI